MSCVRVLDSSLHTHLCGALSRLLDPSASLALHIPDSQSSGAERSGLDELHGLQAHSVAPACEMSKFAVEAFVLESCGETKIATNSRHELWRGLTNSDTCVDWRWLDNLRMWTCSEVKARRPCGPTYGPSAQWATPAVSRGASLLCALSATSEHKNNTIEK